MLVLAWLLPSSVTALAQPSCPEPAAVEGKRYIAVISDLHFGQGKNNGRWHPQEDFRWSGALAGYLDTISRCGRDAVDLVIAGDMLELWQPPEGMACHAGPADDGCTPKELTRITQHVVAQHSGDLAAIGRFADRGANRVYVVPGNHDAALMLPAPWMLVQAAMRSSKNRVQRVDSGIWVSSDRYVVVEHGHQIGKDVNRYDGWPDIMIPAGDRKFVVRPWGERFVQRLFNEQELDYPVIDNLSPEAAGVRYRMADRGLWKSAGDMARFLAFNLFETSLQQKITALGEPGTETAPWSEEVGRKYGHRLFADSLDPDDPFRAALLGDTDEGKALRDELDAYAQDPGRLSKEEVESLCAQMAIRTDKQRRCVDPSLGAAAQALLQTKRGVMKEHLLTRLKDEPHKRMHLFVYAHTHELEVGWPVQVTDVRSVTVFNTGAFQRVVDEKGFLSRATAAGLPPQEALRKLGVGDLAPCYTTVLVAPGDPIPVGRTLQWVMNESAPGRFVDIKDAACN
jgi:UDP-2,3-diacylglucosamine pyrophosphatase LpxH